MTSMKEHKAKQYQCLFYSTFRVATSPKYKLDHNLEDITSSSLNNSYRLYVEMHHQCNIRMNNILDILRQSMYEK